MAQDGEIQISGIVVPEDENVLLNLNFDPSAPMPLIDESTSTTATLDIVSTAGNALSGGGALHLAGGDAANWTAVKGSVKVTPNPDWKRIRFSGRVRTPDADNKWEKITFEFRYYDGANYTDFQLVKNSNAGLDLNWKYLDSGGSLSVLTALNSVWYGNSDVWQTIELDLDLESMAYERIKVGDIVIQNLVANQGVDTRSPQVYVAFSLSPIGGMGTSHVYLNNLLIRGLK